VNSPILAVRFYRTASGHEPVRAFLLDLTTEDRKAIGTDIKEVQFGWPLGMPLVRKVDSDLWEVRSHIADGIARVLFTVAGQQMVLLCQSASKFDHPTASNFDQGFMLISCAV